MKQKMFLAAAAAGWLMPVAAMTNPTDIGDTFRATVSIVDGEPVVSWEPTLSAAEAAKRTYTILGRQSLRSGNWEAVSEGQSGNYNFFKVTVEMKAE